MKIYYENVIKSRKNKANNQYEGIEYFNWSSNQENVYMVTVFPTNLFHYLISQFNLQGKHKKYLISEYIRYNFRINHNNSDAPIFASRTVARRKNSYDAPIFKSGTK